MSNVADDSNWSHKAWMSVTDADLFESVLLKKGRSRSGTLEVLEWGTGRSTLWYSGVLREADVPYRWTSIEYDRAYFESAFLSMTKGRADVATYLPKNDERLRLPARQATPQETHVVCFDHGKLQPFLEDFAGDRIVNMDAYVELPSLQERRYDVILVDGRKRRRCLLEAAKLLAPGGIAVLHDAYRKYYHCAFQAFASHRFAGDMLWFGTQGSQQTLESLLSST